MRINRGNIWESEGDTLDTGTRGLLGRGRHVKESKEFQLTGDHSIEVA